MDSGQIGSIIIFLICMALSAFFSASETAFTSMRKAKLNIMVKEGDSRAKKALKLHDNYDNLLSTILIGNNIVNIAASSVATLFFVKIFPLYGALISTVITTILLLMFSEISPKLIAKILPEKIAMRFTPGLNFVMKLLFPVVWFMSNFQKLVKKFVPQDNEATVSEDELLHYMDEAKKEGSIEEDEHILVKRAMEFDDENVSSILIPRVDVIAVDINDEDHEVEEVFEESSYSRLVVYEETIDKILGLIHEKDFNKYLKAKLKGESDKTLRDLITDILYIPGTIKLADVLKLMQKDKIHMAAIIDEHGGFEGLVTMEDLLEELVGDIWDESDEEEQDIRVLVKGQVVEMSGRMDLEDAFEFLKLPNVEDYHSNTFSGFITEVLDRMPEINDTFDYKDYRFVVKEIENNRVEKVIVRLIEK